jgi:hypothetical protein
MPYTKQQWTDEAPQELVRYSINDDVAGEVAASAEIAVVSSVTAGSPVNAERLNYMEDGIEAAHDAADAAAAFSGARLVRNADFEVAGSGTPNIEWDSEIFDTDDYFDAGSPTKLTAPQDGYYEAGGAVRWEDATLNFSRREMIRVNDISRVGETRLRRETTDADYDVTTRQVSSGPIFLSQGDFVELEVSQNTGSPMDILGATGLGGEQVTHFWIKYLGS